MLSRQVLPAVLLLAVGVACTTNGEPVTDTQADEAAMRSAVQEWIEAANADDVEGMLEVIPDDGVTMPPNEPAFTGREALRAWHQARVDGFHTEIALSSEEIRVAHDWAFERFTYQMTVTPREGGEPVRDTGKGIWIWERHPDDSWKLAHSIWNSDLPIPAAQ